MNLDKLSDMTQREICAYVIKIEKALDKACEYLTNVETDSCYYCPFGIKGYETDCKLHCSKKEDVKEFVIKESEKD